jgi:hypothetical protein
LVSRVENAGFQVRMVTSFVTLLLPLMALSRVSGRLKRQDLAEFDPWAEFRIPRFVNATFETLASAERYAIARGLSLPAGGSLLIAGAAV